VLAAFILSITGTTLTGAFSHAFEKLGYFLQSIRPPYTRKNTPA